MPLFAHRCVLVCTFLHSLFVWVPKGSLVAKVYDWATGGWWFKPLCSYYKICVGIAYLPRGRWPFYLNLVPLEENVGTGFIQSVFG